ncbi:MAG: hypothetical protein ABJH44_01645, partial [Balneola sp.]
MKNHLIKFSVLVSIIFLSACNTEKSNTKEDDSLNEENFYLGQEPPGLIPKVFASDIVSINGRNASAISFSPDLDEMYFSAHEKDEETSSFV